MVNEARTKKPRTRNLISVLLAGALLMPAVPLSEVTPAFANAGSQLNETVPLEPTTGQIRTTVSLDGPMVTVDAQGNPITNEVVNELPGLEGMGGLGALEDPALGLTDAPSGEDLLCGDCLGEADSANEEAQQQEAELEAAAQAALDQADVPTHEEVLAAEAQVAVEEESEAEQMRAPAVAPQAMLGQQSAAAAQSGSFARADVPAYSTEVILKDIKSIDIYSSSDGASYAFNDRIWTHPTISPTDFSKGNYSAYVSFHRMPSFFGQVTEGHFDDEKRYWITVKLPAAEGEEQQTIQLQYGVDGSLLAGYHPSNYAYPLAPTTLTDDDILASFSGAPGYDAARATAYLNAYKLAPYASIEDIVASGNRIPAGSGLATKAVSECWPAHEKDGMKVSLMKEDVAGVVRFLAYYTDGTSEAFNVDLLGTSGLAASYVAKDAGFLCQPDFWFIDGVSRQGVDRVASFIRSKTWDGFFGAYFTKQSASKNVKIHRTVRNFFDQDMHENAEEVAANLLTNIPLWSPTAADGKCFSGIMTQAEAALPTQDYDDYGHDATMFHLLFLYTYWGRFLDFDMGGSPEVGAQKNANAFLVLAFRGDVIRSGLSLLSMTSTVRPTALLTFSYVERVSTTVMNGMLAPYTGIYNSVALTQTLVKRLTNYDDMADWFADYMPTIAFYHEYAPLDREGITDQSQLTWRGWNQVSRFPDQLLLWLTLPPGSQYMASTSMLLASGPTGVYYVDANLQNEEHQAFFTGKLDGIFEPARRYATTIATIVGVDRPNSFCVMNLDSKTSRYDGGTSFMEREMLWGKTLSKDPYHIGFTDTTGYYISSGQGAAAMTINQSDQAKRIHFLAYTALGCSWSYFWSHEMAHAIDNTIFLNGNRRGGNNTEDYTDGLLTQSFGAMSYSMNLCFQYEKSTDIMSNFTAERVEGKDNLDDFYGKLYDTIDVVDYAALQAFLRLDKDEQNAVASQVWYSGQNGTSALDAGATADTLYSRNYILGNYDGTVGTMPVNASVFNDGSKKFETVEEVYDNQIFLRPGIANNKGETWLWANYVSDDLRGVWWYPIHCNGNRPDSRSFKLQMYRLFGSNGFDAFSEFGRSGGGDLAKLQKITGYGSFKEWQLAKWDAIEERKDSLGYVPFDDLVDKFEAALKTDASANDRNLTQMHALRVRMMYLMKRMTDDFRYGIYENQAPVKTITDAAGLLAIADDPFGNYVLADDIDVAGLDLHEDAVSIVNTTFFGKLDGQGHRIYSSQNEIVPVLFAGAKTAYLKDFTVEGVAVQAPARSLVNCEVENLAYTQFERQIHSVDDFLKMQTDLKLGLTTFHLMADLDFTEWSAANAAAEGSAKQTAVITQAMAGTASVPKVLNGNSHTIRGLIGASLFDRVAYADIHELNFVDAHNDQDVDTGTYAALVAKRTYKSSFADLYFTDVSVSGRLCVGFVCGDDGIASATNPNARDGGSTFRRIQVFDGTVTAGGPSTTSLVTYVGFVAGRGCMSTMEDIYLQGSLQTHGTGSGGMVGALTKWGRYDRCVSNVNVVRKKATYDTSDDKSLQTKVGVLIGEIEGSAFDASNSRIANCVAVGKATDKLIHQSDANAAARFANYTPAAAAAVFESCYECMDCTGGMSLSGGAVPGILSARTTCFPWGGDAGGAKYVFDWTHLRNNEALYDGMGFDRGVWQFDPTLQVGYPMLRFEGDVDAFYDYDLDISVDFENEFLFITGADADPHKVRVHNLPYYASSQTTDKVYKPGSWMTVSTRSNGARLYLMSDDLEGIDLSRIIEQGPTTDVGTGQIVNGFNNDEVASKGSRSVTLMLESSASGKPYSFEKTVEVPPRLESAYASNIKGVSADRHGMGAIQVLSVGSGDMPGLEYRAVVAADDGESADAADQPWIPLTQAVTPVAAGTYEVRESATDHSFASYPCTVTVDEFDPESVLFPLTLDPMGGVWSDPDTVPLKYSSLEATKLPGAQDIAREGYTFIGWYASEDASGVAIEEIPAGNDAAITLYAGWRANSYGITWNLGGGSFAAGDAGAAEYEHGTAVPLPEPVRPGYEFMGWYENAAFEGDPVTQISADAVGAKSFFAKWEACTYTVTLHPNDGELAEDLPASFAYSFGSGASLPDALQITRMGYAFGGWFEDAACAGSPVASLTATDFGDKDLYAKWTACTYSVTLATNGGTFAEGGQDVTSYQHDKGALLPELVRPGYVFAGWYADPDFADQPTFSIDASEVGDKNFWAKWEPLTYSVTYDLGSYGGESPEGIDLSAYESRQMGEALKLPDASVMAWEGRTFAGWYESPDFAGAPVTEIAADRVGDVSLYAKWMGHACVILYHVNGGAFAEEPQSIFEFGEDGWGAGSVVHLPGADDIGRSGYAFEGWYASADFAGDVLGSVELFEGTIEVHAKWSLVEYGISFDLGEGAWVEGVEAPAAYTIASGDVVLPGPSAVVREGFAFEGWYESADFEGETCRVIGTGSTGDKAFFAKWVEEGAEDPGPSVPDVGYEDLKVVSVALQGTDLGAIPWDENDHGLVKLPRSQMPQTAEDFSIKVPEGVECSVAKRERSLLYWLARLVQVEGEHEVWDILLRSTSVPTVERDFVLELVPMDEEEEQPPVMPPDEEEEQPPVAPPEGGQDPVLPPEEEEQPPVTPPTDGDVQQPPTSPGSTEGPSGRQPVVGDAPAGDGGSGGGSESWDDVPLAQTGDDAPVGPLLLLIAGAALSATLLLRWRRHS